MEYKKLWIALAVVLVASFSVLGGVGYHAIHNGPPTPTQVKRCFPSSIGG